MRYCSYCGKEFTKKTSYKKHIIVCEILQDISKREKSILTEESTNIPTNLELYKVILELCSKQEKLENQIKKLQNTQKKINVIDWLNKNIVPEISYYEWIKHINIDNFVIDFLFEKSITDTLSFIINKHLYSSISLNPLFGFIQKTNLLYKYENHEMKWVKLTQEDFIYLLKNIEKILFKSMCTWQKENICLLQKDEYLETKFNNAMIKITSAIYDSESLVLTKVRTNLYNKIKYELSLCEMIFE